MTQLCSASNHDKADLRVGPDAQQRYNVFDEQTVKHCLAPFRTFDMFFFVKGNVSLSE